MKQEKKPEHQRKKEKVKLKSPLKAILMLVNDEGWEKAIKLSEEALAEIFAQFREELIPELRVKKNRK